MKSTTTIFLFILLIASFSIYSQVTLDPTFGNGGKVTTDLLSERDQIWSMALQSDGKIIACGAVYEPDAFGDMHYLTLVRYNTNGSIDTSFGTTGIIRTFLNAEFLTKYNVKIQDDGKILVAGTKAIGTLRWRWGMARYNPDGSLDTTFGTNGEVIYDNLVNQGNGPRDMIIQPDHKIILVGSGCDPNSLPNNPSADFMIMRYNSNGTIDSSFGIDGAVYFNFGYYIYITSSYISINSASCVKIQADGKIVIAGQTNADTFDDGGENNEPNNIVIIRLNTDGSLDTSFGTNGKVFYDFGEDDDPLSLAITPDNKLLVGGGIWNYTNYTGKMLLIKMNQDGSLDSTFGTNGQTTTQISATSDYIGKIILQDDGKILAAGSTKNDSGNYDYLVLRYNADGSLDTNFNTTGYASTNFNSTSNDYGHAVLLQEDGKIVLGGKTGINNSYDYGLARYNVNNLSTSAFESKNFTVSPNPATSILTISNKNAIEIQSIEIYNTVGQLVSSDFNANKTNLDVSGLKTGVYYLKIITRNGDEVVKFLKN